MHLILPQHGPSFCWYWWSCFIILLISHHDRGNSSDCEVTSPNSSHPDTDQITSTFLIRQRPIWSFSLFIHVLCAWTRLERQCWKYGKEHRDDSDDDGDCGRDHDHGAHDGGVHGSHGRDVYAHDCHDHHGDGHGHDDGQDIFILLPNYHIHVLHHSILPFLFKASSFFLLLSVLSFSWTLLIYFACALLNAL